MKKILILLVLSVLASSTFAQSLTYNQLQSIFMTWMQSKGANVSILNKKLNTINPKWKIVSYKPMIAQNGEEKYYAWTTLDTKKDTTAIAVYIEEDATTIKYSLKYAFHNNVSYNGLVKGLRASTYYANRITTETDESKGETSLFGHPDESLPIANRIDFLLSDYNLNSDDTHPRLYTVDIFSRYIPK